MNRAPMLWAAAAFTLAAVAATPPTHANSPPVVSNVVATQVAGTGTVRVTYDVSDADGDQVTARLVCSSNGGSTFDLLPITVSGHVNVAMAPGPGKQILWNAAADYPGRYWSSVVAKVYASDGPAFSGERVLVPAGNFTMGSTSGFANEQPQHTVYLEAFYIDKYEVTNAEFKQFIDADGYNIQAFWSAAGWNQKVYGGWTSPLYWNSDYPFGPAAPGFPVVGISWYEAEAYANFAGKSLPTEAQWEKAARGTDARTYPWGANLDGSRANFNSSGDPFESYVGISPVGFFDGRLYPNPPFQTTDSPSPYGAYDVAGNVSEWVKDWMDDGYYSSSPPSNPPGPVSGAFRCRRGGGYGNSVDGLRCASRSANTPIVRSSDIGFRCVSTGP